MPKVSIRKQRLSDAKKFYEILNNPNFKYFSSVDSVEAEKEILIKHLQKWKDKKEYNFTILYADKIVGACGIKMNPHPARKHVGEIGYFLDEKYWGRGITTRAVKLLECFAFDELKLNRVEIVMHHKHNASEKVAIKSGYKKEGKLKKYTNIKGKLADCYMYSKVK